MLDFSIAADTPEEEHGKIKWWESKGIEVAQHEPTGKKETYPAKIEKIVLPDGLIQKIYDEQTYLKLSLKAINLPT